MSLSLYRRWRPRTFADLVGQEAVVRTLQTALSSGKLAHAYLFSGPRGSGKTSAAKILARCIDCVNGPAPEPDNTCENCVAMLAGTALDVQEIDAASYRGIDQIRDLRDSAKFAPASMRSKVFIIDEAHALTRDGANAFLKTLEEPPAHVVFVLATTAPEALPPTILSRCQRYAFRRIPVDVTIERMREISGAEGILIGDDALGAIAYRSDGGLRDALTMLEQVAAFAGEGAQIDAATVEAAFGVTGRTYAKDLVGALLGGEAPRALRIVDAAADAGTEMQGFVRALIGEFRNLLVARIDPDLLSRDLAPEDAARTVERAGATSQARVVRALRLLADALASGRLSGNPRLELETAILRLVVAAEDPTVDALSARVAHLEELLGGKVAPVTSPPAPEPKASVRRKPAPEMPRAAAPPPAPPPAEPAAPPPADPAAPTLQRVRSLWDQIRTRVYESANPLRAPLSRATIETVADGAVTIGIVDAPTEGFVRERAGIIEDALADVLGTRLRVIVRCTGGPPPRAAHRAMPQPASEEAVDGEPDLLAYARMKMSGAAHGTETR